MNEKVIMAGFGGQGVMSIGKMLAYAGMLDGKEVSWLPSYGPEMRGGTANCAVMVSEHQIGSPVITNDATSAIIMNLPSLDKFENDVVSGGTLIINSSLITQKPSRTDVKAVYVPANEIAMELGNPKVANIVMLGAYLELSKCVTIETTLKAFLKVFGENKVKFLDINKAALEKGAEAARA
ncbi:MAG: 2-oxoacid:acceptor oxidoreductase family protein [Filifactoraceae bacterium]